VKQWRRKENFEFFQEGTSALKDALHQKYPLSREHLQTLAAIILESYAKEYPAAESITPGELANFIGSFMQKHSVQDVNAMFGKATKEDAPSQRRSLLDMVVERMSLPSEETVGRG